MKTRDELDAMLATDVLSDPAVLDGLPAHQSRVVQSWLKQHNDKRDRDDLLQTLQQQEQREGNPKRGRHRDPASRVHEMSLALDHQGSDLRTSSTEAGGSEGSRDLIEWAICADERTADRNEFHLRNLTSAELRMMVGAVASLQKMRDHVTERKVAPDHRLVGEHVPLPLSREDGQ